MRLTHVSWIVVAALLVTACDQVPLRVLSKPGEGPDEFRIVPGKPLEQPESFSALPVPTPGGANRTDQQPAADAVAALGGRVPAATDGIPAADGTLVNQASRFGRDGNIRADLAEEDADFRRRKSRLTQIRIAPVDRYGQIYRRETLKPGPEAERWRRAGARVPSAPPE